MTSIDFVNIPNFVTTTNKTYNGQSFVFKNLDNEFLPHADIESRIYRSALLDSNGKLICLAPSKSISRDYFAFNKQVRITEYVEGTMINLFWCPLLNSWEIATKKSVGGEYFYFRNQYKETGNVGSQKTFRAMFLDALQIESLDQIAGSLDKSICYSFVLQHPDNHIVYTFAYPEVYLVGAYKIWHNNSDPIVYNYEYVDVWTMAWPSEFARVRLPRVLIHDYNGKLDSDAFCADVSNTVTYSPETNEMVDRVVQNPLNTHECAGLMITDIQSGQRSTVVNPKYMEIKLLRGNHPNLHFQYLVLRKTHKVNDFLHYFPQYRNLFYKFYDHFGHYVIRLHKLYLNVHVLKITKLEEITDKRDKYHVEKLHYEVFIPELRRYLEACKQMEVTEIPGRKPKITRGAVAKYLDKEGIMVPFDV